MPGCVAVAQRTLNPLAQVRILARQPTKIRTKTDALKLLNNTFRHSERSEESRLFAIAQGDKIGNPDGKS